MAAKQIQLKCNVYASAFSGEYCVEIPSTEYAGIIPKRYVKIQSTPDKQVSVPGIVSAHLIETNYDGARVRMPDNVIIVVRLEDLV